MKRTESDHVSVEPFGIKLAAGQRGWARLPFSLLATLGGIALVLNVISSLATARQWFMAEEVSRGAAVELFAVIWVFTLYMMLTLVGAAAGTAIARRERHATRSWKRSLGQGYFFASLFAGLNNLAGTLSLAIQDGRWIL